MHMLAQITSFTVVPLAFYPTVLTLFSHALASFRSYKSFFKLRTACRIFRLSFKGLFFHALLVKGHKLPSKVEKKQTNFTCCLQAHLPTVRHVSSCPGKAEGAAVRLKLIRGCT